MLNQQTTGAGDDLEKATEMARKMVCEWGMSDKLGPLTFGKNEEHIFLGREVARQKDYSEDDRAPHRLRDQAHRHGVREPRQADPPGQHREAPRARARSPRARDRSTARRSPASSAPAPSRKPRRPRSALGSIWRVEPILAGVSLGSGLPVGVMGVLNVSPESFHAGSVHAARRRPPERRPRHGRGRRRPDRCRRPIHRALPEHRHHRRRRARKTRKSHRGASARSPECRSPPTQAARAQPEPHSTPAPA